MVEWDRCARSHMGQHRAPPRPQPPALILYLCTQFGFDGSNIWKKRRDALFETLLTNPKAKFVTRVLQFGSEPLFDRVLPSPTLAQQVIDAQGKLSSLNIPVTISELAYGYQSRLSSGGSERAGALSLLANIDVANAHTLPFFSARATTGQSASIKASSAIR
jgi:hypothetical protein